MAMSTSQKAVSRLAELRLGSKGRYDSCWVAGKTAIPLLHEGHIWAL